MPKIVIGLVGPIASGKGTVVRVLSEKGYAPYSLSDALRDEVRRRGLEFTRYNFNRISNELRKTQGADILAKRTAEAIVWDNPPYVVIDAIRNPAEIEFLKQKFDAKIIGVIGDQKKRYELFKARGTFINEIDTFKKFKELDDQETQQVGKHKQQIRACLDIADIIIENNGTIEELRANVEDFIRSLDKI